MLLIIWAKNCNFFQKCTEKPLTAWTNYIFIIIYYDFTRLVEVLVNVAMDPVFFPNVYSCLSSSWNLDSGYLY